MTSTPPRILVLTAGTGTFAGLDSAGDGGELALRRQNANDFPPSAEELSALDFVLVDGQHAQPFDIVRRVRRIDPSVQIGVLVPDPAVRVRVAWARHLATGVGEIWLVQPEQLATAAARAVEVTSQRRHFRRSVASYHLSARMGRVPLKQPGHLSNTYLAALLETIPVGVVTLDGQDRIVGWNRTAAHIFGRPLETVAGTPIRTLFPTTAWEQVAALLRVVENEESVSRRGASRVSVLRADGTTGVVEADAAMAAAGGLRMRSLVLHDVSERDRLERQVQQAQRMEAVGRLAGGAAHEINNALQGVLGFAHLALKVVDPADPLHPDLEQIVRAGKRAASITEGLLAFGRRQLRRPSSVNFGQLVEEFAPMLRQALGPDRELHLTLPAAPVAIHADRGQLEQVLLNLALNARDALGPGGHLHIKLSEAELTHAERQELGLHNQGADRWARLEVEDNGQGIDSASLGKIFEPFFTTKPIGYGTGLGLSVVHGIIHQSGGGVTVRSTVGMGTAFTIYLPTTRAVPAESQPGSATELPGGRERVLVVDDEPMVRELVVRLLSDAGYRTLAAEDGAAALRRLEEIDANNDEAVDLVLTDFIMPGMDGRELGRQLATAKPSVRILYMSGHATDAEREATQSARSVPCIQKPFEARALLAWVRAILEEPASPTRSAESDHP